MQRWHLTLGLSTLAGLGLWLAPRLFATPAATVAIPIDPIPEAEAEAEAEAVAVNVPIDTPAGHLQVSMGLDRTAVLVGKSEDRWVTVQVTAPKDVGEVWRRPVDLAVVMDVSGSMTARGKIDYARQAAKGLASAVQDGDTFALITFADDAHVVIPAGPVHDASVVHQAIDRIYEGGGTNLYGGLVKGREEVRRTLHAENVGRVVLLSDGNPTVGIQDGGALGRLTAEMAADGVAVSVVGLGVDYNERLLEQLADMGGGSYDFVNDPSQLQRVFADELERTAATVARDLVVDLHVADGVEGLEVVGWPAERIADGWRVNMGSVQAGETKKIVARVRVKSGAEGTTAVAALDARYVDLVDQAERVAHAKAEATATRDAAVVHASVDKKSALAAAQAWGNERLVASTEAFRAGRVAEAEAIANDAGRGLREMNFSDDLVIAETIQNLDVSASTWGSAPTASAPAVQAQMKMNRAFARDSSR